MSVWDLLIDGWLPRQWTGERTRWRGRVLITTTLGFSVVLALALLADLALGAEPLVPRTVAAALWAATLVVPPAVKYSGAVRALGAYWTIVLLAAVAAALFSADAPVASPAWLLLPLLPILGSAVAGRPGALVAGSGAVVLAMLAFFVAPHPQAGPRLLSVALLSAFSGYLGLVFERYREDAVQRILLREEGFRRLSEHAADVVFRIRLTPSTHLDYLNPAGVRVLGEPAGPQALAPRAGELLRSLTELEPQAPLALNEADPHPEERSALSRWRTPDGNLVWLESRYGLFVDRDGSVYAEGIARDVSGHKQVEQSLWHDANHDVLTGLPNRAQLERRLAAAVEDAQHLGTESALLYLDLDGFKSVNDTCGHEAGDAVLQAVASRIAGTLRDTDTAFRIGGDEFVVLLTDVTHPDAVQAVARRILTTLDRPFTVEDQRIEVGVSIGVAHCPHDGTDADALLRNADGAMYQAKRSGGGRWSMHSDIHELRPRGPEAAPPPPKRRAR